MDPYYVVIFLNSCLGVNYYKNITFVYSTSSDFINK